MGEKEAGGYKRAQGCVGRTGRLLKLSHTFPLFFFSLTAKPFQVGKWSSGLIIVVWEVGFSVCLQVSVSVPLFKSKHTVSP